MTNWAGIRYLSIEKNLNILEVLIDTDREKNSASNEPIFIEIKSDFYGLPGQKLVWGHPESPSDVSSLEANFSSNC